MRIRFSEVAMLQDVRRVSRGVFDATYRLEIIAGVYRIKKDDFTTRDLLDALEHPLDNDNNAGRNLKKLAQAGLLGHETDLWHREPSTLWRFCGALYRELVEMPAAARPRRRSDPMRTVRDANPR